MSNPDVVKTPDRPGKCRLALFGLSLFGAFLVLFALPLLYGGVHLMLLGGSAYYLAAGIALLASGLLLVSRRRTGLWLYGTLFAATIVWALVEVGPVFWPLVPRLVAPSVLAVFALLLSAIPDRSGRRAASRPLSLGLAALLVTGLAAGVVHGMTARAIVAADTGGARQLAAGKGLAGPAEWRHYGRTASGTRFSPLAQIGPANVASLTPAWSFRMGVLPEVPGHIPGEEQNTPLQVGDTLFLCNAVNIVFALNADTGRQRWRFDPVARSPVQQRCRGLGYHERSDLQGACARRVILTTIDARMIALDAASGRKCDEFGTGGTVDLKEGLGEVKTGFYQQTSAPLIAGDLVVVGGMVMDNQEVNAPSGVIRAYDVRSGALKWAWDMGNEARTGAPPPGEHYTRDTPNMWGTATYDEALGLVYIPTGNQTPDFWGGRRTRVVDDHTSAIVALDAATGRKRWVFRTVNHDVWDYDVAAQPSLHDIPDGKGGVLPALVALTKRGQIFLLDRRSGKPLADVVEKPAPQATPPAGDWLAPTQPYSVGMPAIGADPLSEEAMWGATPLDQLWCRIEFRKLGYQGEFTPNSTDEMLIYPGFLGGFNWGGGAVDEDRDLLIVNDIRMPLRQRLVPRREADPRLRRAGRNIFMPEYIGLRPQYGLPWAVEQDMFLSPLGIPCNAPPWGTISAIDLKTRKLVWQIPGGTIRDAKPKGVPVGIPVPIGMPTLGAPIATASGLVFYAGTQDYYLRAFDSATGRELWKGRLPVGSQATPMTYVSPKTGRQYVAVVAGGARMSPDKGDFVVAYALPLGARK